MYFPREIPPATAAARRTATLVSLTSLFVLIISLAFRLNFLTIISYPVLFLSLIWRVGDFFATYSQSYRFHTQKEIARAEKLNAAERGSKALLVTTIILICTLFLVVL